MGDRYRIVAHADPHTPLAVDVTSQITRDQYIKLDKDWRDYKDSHQNEFGIPPDNHHWSWEQKSSLDDDGTYKVLVVEYAGEVQGIMMLREQPVTSRKPGADDQEMMYVEYLETAPWNQRAYAGNAPRFRGVGTCLISAAIDRSAQYGFGGRLALHSLKAARKFYEDQGFEDLGIDSEFELHYFELSDDSFED